MNTINRTPDLIIVDEADYTETDLDHPFAREAEQPESGELVLDRGWMLERRLREIAHPEWW